MLPLCDWFAQFTVERFQLLDYLHGPSNSHFEHGGGYASDMTAWPTICQSAGLTGLGDVTSLCARSRGEPSSAHCEQRLSERLTPCPCDPVCACTGMRDHAGRRHCSRKSATRISVCDPTRSAASRAGMAGWAGEGGGRFGERREYEAPTLPSTPRQHGMARHQTRQPRNTSPPPKQAHKPLRQP